MKVVLVWNGPADPHEGVPLIRRQVPLLAALERQGVRPVVALLDDRGGLGEALDGVDVAVERLPTGLPPAGAALRNLPAAVLAIRGVVRRHGPDLVEGDEPMPAIAAALGARGLCPAIVYRRHHAGGRRRLLAASRLAARLSARTVVSSESMRRRAAMDDAVPIDRIDVTPSGAADPPRPTEDELESLRRELQLPADAAVVVCVARLRREKGVDVLIDAMDALRDLPHARLVVVGEGPEEPALRAQAGAAVPVRFAGFRRDVAPWLALADVVAMPSRRETFGRVTLEAMAAGRPIVATRVGGLEEAIPDGDCGLLVAPDDPAAFAAALRLLLTDRARAREMGARARLRYESRYTLERMATSWRLAWERAAAGAPA